MKYNRYTKKLQNKIKQLNLNYEDTGGLLVCLYLYGGCPEEDCAKLFEFTLDSIIDYLKYEQIYGYKICQNCEHLKERNDIEFKSYMTSRKNTNVCTECKKIKHKKYRQVHFKYYQTYDIHYRNKNKDTRQEYMKDYNKSYQEEHKEKLQKQKKLYTIKNRKNKQKYDIVYRNKLANEELLQKLELYEEVNGNQIKCRYCGDWFTPKIQEVYNRLQGISNNDICYIYCSEKCKIACPVYRKVLHPEGFKKATSREVNPAFRQLVFERDSYTCQKCFTHKDKLNCPLHCHHINPYVNSPIEDCDIDNGITLCKDCHKEVHQTPGCGYNELKCGKKD